MKDVIKYMLNEKNELVPLLIVINCVIWGFILIIIGLLLGVITWS